MEIESILEGIDEAIATANEQGVHIVFYASKDIAKLVKHHSKGVPVWTHPDGEDIGILHPVTAESAVVFRLGGYEEVQA